MSNEMMKREMQEAVQAGERALQSLYAARDKLGSARNWGIFDMLGGGFITEYAELKYRHRYLAGRKKAENGQLCKRCKSYRDI